MKAFWITYYSYKGGVGRSLALANLAALLVERGRRVVLIDFDLEAPGLDCFEEFGAAVSKPGVVEYAAEFIRTGKAPDISAYVHPCELPGPLPGKLWIMPAGRKDADYNRQRSSIDWVQLYDSGLGEPFVENWKAALNRKFQPDYVFVDSRTGLTDVGGICTLHLPDLIVMVFGLNEQNIKGIAAVAKTIRESDAHRIPQVHYVASPVPNIPPDKRSLLTERLEAASKELGIQLESMIRYHAPAALSERLFVLQHRLGVPQIARDYEALLKRVVDYNRNGIDFLAKQVDDAVASSDSDRVKRLLGVLEKNFAGRADGLELISRLTLATGRPDQAAALSRKAFELDPLYPPPFEWLLSYYKRSRMFRESLQICDSLLRHADRLSRSRLLHIHFERGTVAMAADEPAAARESFVFCLQHAKHDEPLAGSPALRLVHSFNLAEASRRASGKVDQSAWKGVIKLFEHAGETSDVPLPLQANRWQAMHVPFALTGSVPKAKDALAKARHAAELLGDIEDMFSVKTYTDVPVPEFLTINDQMSAALERGQLWDKMKLPNGKRPALPTRARPRRRLSRPTSETG
jgi:tetratricopeptide (TPR) repeat protein